MRDETLRHHMGMRKARTSAVPSWQAHAVRTHKGWPSSVPSAFRVSNGLAVLNMREALEEERQDVLIVQGIEDMSSDSAGPHYT